MPGNAAIILRGCSTHWQKITLKGKKNVKNLRQTCNNEFEIEKYVT